MDKQYILDNTVLLVRGGSRAYGIHNPLSDEDLRGVVCVGPEYYMGLKAFEQFEGFDDDQVRFDLRKFIILAVACNPNIIELLFVDPSDILECTKVGEALMAIRESFLSLKAKHTFTGYAMSQLKRIQSKYRWITNPPATQPEQADFYREPRNEVEMGLLAKGTKIYDKEAYQKARHDWANYQQWLNERNPARKELETKYGYDTKHAMHLMRLLRMGREIMVEGIVRTRRPDADELFAIRHGSMKYEDLVGTASGEMAYIDSLYEEYKSGEKTPPVPMKPNHEKIHRIAIGLALEHWRYKGWLTGKLEY